MIIMIFAVAVIILLTLEIFGIDSIDNRRYFLQISLIRTILLLIMLIILLIYLNKDIII